MWRWIVTKWKRFLEMRQKKKELSTESFRALAKDIREIASLSGQLWIRDSGFQERIKRIHAEMDHLDNLVERRTFEHLSLEKKEELRQSLLVSKEELLKSIQSAPCPTDRLQ